MARCACGWPALEGRVTCGRLECDEAVSRAARSKEPDVFGGRFYERGLDGKMHAIDAVDVSPLRPPDAWICRRVADYPGARVPAGGAVAGCTKCHVAIVFNPLRIVAAPKICMQCAHIQPLPMES